MRKIFCSFMAMAAIAVALVSCQKEDFSNGPVFRASVESADKTEFHTTDLTFTWKHNDRIHIWDAEDNHKLYMPSTDGSTTTNIAPVGNYVVNGSDVITNSDNLSLASSSHYVAVYPDFYFDTTNGRNSNSGSVIVTLPASQCITNQEDDISDLHLTRFPMYCESNNHQLPFKNLCGALRLNLQRSGMSVSRIKFTSGANDPVVCGKFSIDWNNGDPRLDADANNNEHSVILEYAQAVSIASATDFWIALPAGTYSDFRIDITCIKTNGAQGTITLKKSENGSPLVIDRSYVTPIVSNVTSAPFHADGVFTVALNPSKKVYFSPGNLQCVNNHWQFATEQYEVIHGYTGASYTTAATNFRQDLFGWSMATSDYGRNTDSSDYTDGSLNTTFVDWRGVFGDTTWFTMKASEWDVLMNQRSTSFIRNGESVRFAPATICTIETIEVSQYYSWNKYTYHADGLLVFPDGFTTAQWNATGITMPNQAINRIGNHPGERGDNMDWVCLSYAQFDALEALGVVWLPLSGYVGAGESQVSSYNQSGSGACCYYWTSTPYARTFDNSADGNPRSALVFYAQTNSLAYIMNGQHRAGKYAVRLVRQAPLN